MHKYTSLTKVFRDMAPLIFLNIEFSDKLGYHFCVSLFIHTIHIPDLHKSSSNIHFL